jgi:superfamily II DNA or RNA helicase
MDKINQIVQGLNTAFIDVRERSNLAYRPQFISNNYREGRKVLSSIEEELLECEEFAISVAFITMGGITPLLQTLEELERKNIPGRIMTTDYLTFSEPKALEKLSTLKNIQLKMYQSSEAQEGFHTKGYIFKEKDLYRIIVGSSNMTLSALTRNKEWNTRLVSTEHGEYAHQIMDEYNLLWNSEYCKYFDEFCDKYRVKYELVKKQKKIARQTEVLELEQYRLQPNKMQVEFIRSLKELRNNGAQKALLISATGTGKTYASAFALREENPRKALFLVHREQIAKQAIESYKKVFGNVKSMGLLSGNSKDFHVDYLFSTMNMMAKPEIRERFRRDEFQTIIIDEAHRTGANSYRNIMSYFKPAFWLGMTASPERTDDFDVFDAFDHNIAYEIRLQQAMEENLLCPFHYFGITDLRIEGNSVDDKSDFNLLTSDTRVDYVIDRAQYYSYSGERVKGLVFCSSKKEAKIFSEKFNNRGFRTIALTGEDKQEKREEAIEQLVSDNEENYLDYIFTVDIFNEGVDIPDINQVIMLRPTESPIVFVQQLGRGLRKAKGKEYVVILDFIGNYENNFMIPIALSGDRSYNKDNIRRYVMEGCRVIPGASTIHFDEIAKSKIFQSINQIKGIKTIIKKSYRDLKYRLGRVPLLIDFYENGEIDPLVILDNYKTYYHFLQNVDRDVCKEVLTEKEILTLEYVSRVVARGKRPHEVEILSEIMEKGQIDRDIVLSKLEREYSQKISKREIDSAISNLGGAFVSKEDERKKFMEIEIIQSKSYGMIGRMQSFHERLKHQLFYKYMQDLVKISRARLHDVYKDKPREDEFVLYEKYSRRDVCQLLNCERDLSSTMYGMKRIGEDACIFITYHKQEGETGKEYLEGKPDYADEFIDNQVFMWDSQIGRGPDSSYIQEVLTAKRRRLFIKKSDSEGVDFYYMGLFEVLEAKAGKKKDNQGRMREITKVKARMYKEVREDLLDYLRSSI